MKKQNTINTEEIVKEATALRWEIGEDFHDSLMESIYQNASEIASHSVYKKSEEQKVTFDQKLDKIVTSRVLGFPIMFLMLAAVFWITIIGSNYPSGFLSSILVDIIQPLVKRSVGINIFTFLVKRYYDRRSLPCNGMGN